MTQPSSPPPSGAVPDPAVPDHAVPDIVRAAHAELIVTDLDRARWFYVDLLGFVVTAADEDALYLRGFEEVNHHSLVLRRGREAAAARLAYRVRTPADLDRAEQYFGERGWRSERVPAGATRGIGAAVRAEDPLGLPVELFHHTDRTERLIQRYDLRRGAEIARIDHFNAMVPDVPAAFGHYEALGFRCSETIEDETTLYAAWMYRKPTVHDIAFTGGAGPRLHHVAFTVAEPLNIVRVCDILGSVRAEGHIERGPGRHGVSNAFYLYLRDPDGHRIEIYTGDYYTGDPDHETVRWSVHDDRRRDFWGGAVVPSWYAEGSAVLGLDGVAQPVHDLVSGPPEAGVGVVVGADGLG